MRRVRSSSNGQIELNLRFSCEIETMSHQHIILPPQLLPLLVTAALVEEYSVSMDGVRQDFIIAERLDQHWPEYSRRERRGLRGSGG